MELENEDVLTVKLDNRTQQQGRQAQAQAQAQSGRVTQTRVVANVPLAPTPKPIAAFTSQVSTPAGHAMRRVAPAQPTPRFQPYQAPVHKGKAMTISPAATPLPNGSDGTYCIFCYGAPNQDILQQLFQPYGVVGNVRMQAGKKFGFVSMPNYAEAVNAITNLNNMTLPGGATLQVRLAQKLEGQ
mmetsp:Transcript_145123/g.253142  ORF Transcript_145123/g.253142 Transcript_145123/m.253142 type:complete len:185 (-) Transcript_145123:443-997(-)